MIFTARVSNGVTSVWCCGSSYYVEPQFRLYGPTMMKKAHRYREVTYFSISQSPHTWDMLGAQGFKRLNKESTPHYRRCARRSQGRGFAPSKSMTHG